MKVSKTNRGFKIGQFEDEYSQICSIQESSVGINIWLGVDNTGPTISGPSGKFNEQISCRMHLGKKQAKMLIKKLQYFVDTGYLK